MEARCQHPRGAVRLSGRRRLARGAAAGQLPRPAARTGPVRRRARPSGPGPRAVRPARKPPAAGCWRRWSHSSTTALSVEAAARALFVHANTVRYRLRRIHEVTGYSPTDPRDAYALRLALTLGRSAPDGRGRRGAGRPATVRHERGAIDERLAGLTPLEACPASPAGRRRVAGASVRTQL